MYDYLNDNDFSKVFDLEEEGEIELKKFYGSYRMGTLESKRCYLEIDSRHFSSAEDLNLTVRNLKMQRFNKKRCYWRHISQLKDRGGETLLRI